MELLKQTDEAIEVRFDRGTTAEEINKVMRVWLKRHWGVEPTRRQPIYMPEILLKPKREEAPATRRRRAA